MQPKAYLKKSEAINEIAQATGYGKFVIEKRINELIGAGRIQFIDDPGDSRRKLLSRAHVQVIIDSLTLPTT